MKWVVLGCAAAVGWLLDAWYLLILVGVLHSWWTQVPTMGWHTSLVVSAVVVVAVVTSKIAGAFLEGFINGMNDVS